MKNLIIDGVEISDNKGKAEAIAEIFEKYHTVSLNNTSSVECEVHEYMQSLNNNSTFNVHQNCLTNITELKFFITQMKNKKSPGLDEINVITLKNMPHIFLKVLVDVYNFCLCNGYFPKLFKKAKVIPILKQGKNANSPLSYRPISLLSVLDKLFEKIIHNRLLEFTETHRIINCEQFGFRKDHSTVHQIKRVVNIIEANKQQRRSTGIVLLDIEKAFDSIWHDGLIFKLNSFGYPMYIQKLIKSFLAERTFVVSILNSFSSTKSIPAGLPQGSVLSPTLYAIFTSDYFARNHETAFYADDSALICSGKVYNAIVKKMKKALRLAVNISINGRSKLTTISPRRLSSLSISHTKGFQLFLYKYRELQYL